MPVPIPTDLPLQIGHVLFIDLVGYSKLLIEDQNRQQRQLSEILSATPQVVKAMNEELVRLPTGDGVALVFWNSSEQPAQCALEATRALKDYPGIEVRMGIHCGPVSKVTDVTGRTNVAGAGINVAQRVMDCGDAGHILLSKHVADDLENYVRWQPLLHDLGEVEVKHGVRVHLVNLCDDEFGRSDLPAKLKQTGQALEARTRHRRRWQLSAAAFVLALLLGGGVWLYFHPATPPPQLDTAIAFPDKSIAVLPFDNLSDEKENAFFADGMQDEIITDLAKVADLKVISRTSVMQYRTAAKRNLREIGQALRVNHVVEGSVQRSGGRVRVRAQLIDARDDHHVWAEQYDGELADVFALQSKLAEEIVAQLQAHLSPIEKAAIERRPTADIAAYDFYLRARVLEQTLSFSSRARENLFEAVRLLDEATARDPAFFIAFCELAQNHDKLYLLGQDRTPARLALAEKAVQTALRLRPKSGDAHLTLAHHLYCILDYDRARAELALAQRSLPNEPRIYELAGYIDRRQNRLEESVRDMEHALELDPRNTSILQQISLTYESLRRFKEMAAVLDRALQVTPDDPGVRLARSFVDLEWRADPKPLQATLDAILLEQPEAAGDIAQAWLYVALCARDWKAATRALQAMPPEGCREASIAFPRAWCAGFAARARGDAAAARTAFTTAKAELEEATRDAPESGENLCAMGLIDAGLGRKEDAIRQGRRAVELIPITTDSINGSAVREYLSVIYTWVDEKDLALTQLEAVTTVPGSLSYGRLHLHPFWDSLRGDPRFEKIVAALAPKEEASETPNIVENLVNQTRDRYLSERTKSSPR